MNQGQSDYSTQRITPQLISQIIEVLKNKAYGSIEIYIENHNVVQITERTITKIQSKISLYKNNQRYYQQKRIHKSSVSQNPAFTPQSAQVD